MIPIDTPRLRLRALCGGDEALYGRIYSDPDLMRHVGAPLSAEEAMASFAVACRQNAAGSGSNWWVAVPRGAADGIGLLGTVRRDGVVEVGVMLLSPWHGDSYAFESVAALVQRSVEQGADVIRMTHSADHAAMVGLMRKLRFERKVGAGDPRWEIDRDRWLAMQAGMPGGFAKAGSHR